MNSFECGTFPIAFFMVSFRKKIIQTHKTLGEIFEAKRRSLYYTIERVSHTVKIAPDYLRLLEQGAYDKLPGDVYTKNFIKLYSDFLGMGAEEMLELYTRERAVGHNLRSTKTFFPGQKREPVKFISRFFLISSPKILRNAAIVCIVLVCLLYIGFKVEAIIRPPDLELLYPEADILSQQQFVEIRGKTEYEAHVVINGQEVLVGEDGAFFEKVNLQEGINEIRVSAKKDYSRENVVYRRVVVVEKTS